MIIEIEQKSNVLQQNAHKDVPTAYIQYDYKDVLQVQRPERSSQKKTTKKKRRTLNQNKLSMHIVLSTPAGGKNFERPPRALRVHGLRRDLDQMCPAGFLMFESSTSYLAEKCWHEKKSW